jgi:hypothetical protein
MFKNSTSGSKRILRSIMVMVGMVNAEIVSTAEEAVVTAATAITTNSRTNNLRLRPP